MIFLLLLAALACCCCFSNSSPLPTGHRLIRSPEEFDKYVLHESLPTLLLIHSSRVEDCKYGFDCASLYASFKKAAVETKGYVRFASIDFAEAEGEALVRRRLQIKEEPPIMMAFSDAPDPKFGRPAQFVNDLEGLDSAKLKSMASALMPRNVPRVNSLDEFIKMEAEAARRKQPLIALLGKKLTTNAMVKAMYAQVRTRANFTLVETDSEHGRAVLSRLKLDQENATRSTLVVAVDKVLGQMVMNQTLAITPDSVLEFVQSIKEERMRKTDVKRVLPRNMFINLSPEAHREMVAHSLPVITWFTPESNATVANKLLSQLLPTSKPAFIEHGISTLVALNASAEHFQVDSVWLEDASKRFDNYADALAFAIAHQKKRNLDLVDVVDGRSVSDFFVQAASEWKNEVDWATSRLVFLYISNDPAPAHIQAAAFAVKPFARFVQLTPPYDDDILRGIHLNPNRVTLPYLVAYVPNLSKEREALAREAEEAAELAKERSGKKGKKHQQQQAPSSSARGVSFHIIPFEDPATHEARVHSFDTITEFCIAMLQILDPARYEETILHQLSRSGTPRAIWGPLREMIRERKLADGSIMPDVATVNGEEEFATACEADKLCAIAFVDENTEQAVMRALEEAKVELERTRLAIGVRLLVINGACHSRVVHALGGDAAMLPSLVLWNRKTDTAAWLRGTLIVESIVDFVRAGKRGRVGMQKLAAGVDVQFERECVSAREQQQENGEEEDELIKEMRLEAEKEEQERAQREREAMAEAKRLKAQEEAERKAARERMNQKANEEQQKRRQRAGEL